MNTDSKKINSVTSESDSHRKLGIFTAVTVILGGDLGIGIFFKNSSVFKSNDNNGVGILLSWLIAAIIVIATAMCFGEIASSKNKKDDSGIAGWAENYLGRRMGRFMHVTTPVMYFSFFTFIVSFFASEALFNIFIGYFTKTDITVPSGSRPMDVNDIPMYYIVLVGVVIFLFFTLLNGLTNIFGPNYARITSIIKFLPLLIIIIAGLIVAPIIGKDNANLFNNQPDVIDPNTGKTVFHQGSINPSGILNAIPAIMFAFDGFTVVGSITSRIKNPKRNIPVAILIALSISAITYIAITIAQIILGQGTAYGVFNIIFDNSKVGREVCTAFISCFIFIAATGVINSLSIAAIFSLQAAIEEKHLFGSNYLLKIGKEKTNRAGMITLIITSCFYFLILALPSMILNNDQILDGATNTVVEFFFVGYGLIVLGSVWNHKTKKVQCTMLKTQVPLGIFSGICCIGIALYSSIYTFLVSPITTSDACSWGLFHSDSGTVLNLAVCSGVFWGIALLFIAVPFINDLLIKLSGNKNNIKLIWQK